MPRRCEGAGDRARCVPTTIGERCAIPCAKQEVSDPCGNAVRCVVVDVEGDTPCVPNGADPLLATSDAGADAQNDATADAGTSAPPPSTAQGGGCSVTAPSRAPERDEASFVPPAFGGSGASFVPPAF